MNNLEALNILIIDDDLDVRERLSNILKRRGYLTLTAQNGLEGLELVKNNPVDIIFCDIVMPEMDGIEFLNKMKENNLKVEVIMVSGLPSVESVTECFERNVVEFMLKPLTIDDILNSLNRAKKRLQEKKQGFDIVLDRMKSKHLL